MTLEALIKIMVENRVLKLKTPKGFDIELSPEAFAAPSTAAQPKIQDEPEERCACGHPLWTEHGDTGCYHGCDLGACERVQEEPAQEEAA